VNIMKAASASRDISSMVVFCQVVLLNVATDKTL
jgi:hypothetical protein